MKSNETNGKVEKESTSESGKVVENTTKQGEKNNERVGIRTYLNKYGKDIKGAIKLVLIRNYRGEFFSKTEWKNKIEEFYKKVV